MQVHELITCVRRANENAENLISVVQFLINIYIYIVKAKLLGQFLGQSFSREHYPPIYQQARKGFIYFITLRIISQGEHMKIVLAYFVDFFVFLGTELSTSFLISPSLTSEKRIFLFSMTD